MNYTTLDEFIAQIKSELPTYADDIDEITVKLNVIDTLKKFGNNICYKNEALVDIRNSKGNLPECFRSLSLILKLNDEELPQKHKDDDYYTYKQTIENPAFFDENSQEYITSCNPKIITEKIKIKGNEEYENKYSYDFLKVVRGFDKSFFNADCLNLHPSIRGLSKDTVNITKNTINTSFREGKVYIQYKSLPSDENGEIVIPEFSTGELYEYISTVVKVNIAEYLIANNLNPTGIAQLYSSWKQSLLPLKTAASRECKFANLGDWQKNWKNQNKRIFHSYSLNNLKL